MARLPPGWARPRDLRVDVSRSTRGGRAQAPKRATCRRRRPEDSTCRPGGQCFGRGPRLDRRAGQDRWAPGSLRGCPGRVLGGRRKFAAARRGQGPHRVRAVRPGRSGVAAPAFPRSGRRGICRPMAADKRRRRPKAPGRASKSAAKQRDPGPPYTVLWVPEAETELRAVRDAAERAAMLQAARVLEANGPRLGFPHQSSVRGSKLKALRELRPRSGRSRWRPLYLRVSVTSFVVLAVGPEAVIDGSGFDAAVRRAERRFAKLEVDSG